MKTPFMTVASLLLATGFASAQIVFTDDFNRADTDRDTDACVSVGAGYVLTKGAGEMDTTGGMNDNQFGFTNGPLQGDNSLPEEIGLHYAGLLWK